jgi:hypothetical protein
MTTEREAYDDGSGSVAKSSAELERDVRRSRAQVEEALHELRDRLSPGEWVDQIAHYGGTFTRGLGQIAKHNPVPVALVGVGLAWILLGSGRNDRLPRAADLTPDDLADPDWPETHPEAESFGAQVRAFADEPAGGSSAAAARARAGLSEAAERTRAGFEEMGSGSQAAGAADSRRRRFVAGARQRAARMRVGVAEGVRRTEARARDYHHRTREGFFHAMQRQPLVLGALGLAAGAALGAMLPPSRQEDELIGDTSDQLKQCAKAGYREGFAKARASVRAASEAARAEAADQGLSREGIESALEAAEHKVASVAEAAAEAAKREAGLQDPGNFQDPGNGEPTS